MPATTAAPQPLGTLTVVDGARIHVHATTNRRGGPTVILDAGLGSFSAAWSLVQPEIAGHADVASFDRPGLGWSDPRPDALGEPHRWVAQLRTALDDAGLRPPFVYVGHSMGGLLGRVFADAFADEVAGIVLVDASHHDQNARFDAARRRYGGLGTVPLAVGMAMTVLRYRSAVRRAQWPASIQPIIAHFEADAAHAAATAAEKRAFAAVAAAAAATQLRRDLPTTVVSAGRSPRGWLELQRELVALSDRGDQIVVRRASHASLVTRAGDARHVRDAVLRHLAPA